MTHADYIAQGYPEIYAVSDVYEETNGRYYVDIYDWSKPDGQQTIKSYGFDALATADAMRKVLEAEVAELEVEVNEDNPQLDYVRSEMAALKEKEAAQ